MSIVELLRNRHDGFKDCLCQEAADEIDELAERVDVLRTVLKEQVEKNKRLQEVVMLLVKYDEHDEDIYKGAVMWEELVEKARAALKGDE